MNRRKTLAIVTLLTLTGYWIVQAGSLEPPGPPAPSMKTMTDVEPRVAIRNDFNGLTPIVIDLPGSYYLAEDIFAFFGQHGIEITASNVDLDLNGFSVIGNTEVGSLNGIEAAVGEQVVVRNGTVRSFFQHGVRLGGNNGRVQNVRAVSNGLDGGVRAGIQVGFSSQVVDSTASDNGWFGIQTLSGGLVSRCHVGGNGDTGIKAGGASLVESSVVYNNLGTGIETVTSLVKGNTVSGNAFAIINNAGTNVDNFAN